MSLGSPWLLLALVVVPALDRRVRRGRSGCAPSAPPGSPPRGSCRRAHGDAYALAPPHPVRALRGGARARSPSRWRARSMNVTLPQREGTVILAFDVSNSMRAEDLEPTRIEAAKSAARGFVERQPSSIKIGVVAFGDSAVTVLRPSNVKEDVLAAINRLSVSGGTSLGQGLYTSLSAIAGKPLTIDESALDSDAGRRRHRLLRLVGDRAALGRREHVPARPAQARRRRVDGGRPRAHDRRRHEGGHGRPDRRLQRGDRARRRPCCRGSPTSPTAPTTRRATRRARRASTSRSTSSSRASRSRGR